ncbi:2'-5'-oligoadenylate synthase 1A [Patella vulgata]|uniref:2'-5'-oligoadenylate synthase 1A n=1 Tax=Patella vulgata TaxID=6465 RepID=UPI00218095FF|nr:2'-5'-oligoadenylate synthase 1A [Patella vulgata]
MSITNFLPDHNGRENLDTFVLRRLYIPKTFNKRIHREVNNVFRYLHEFPDYLKTEGYKGSSKNSIDMIVKGGSLGKCTAVQRTSDMDLVVFFNGYDNMEKFIKEKKKTGGVLDKLSDYMTGNHVSSKHWKEEFRTRDFHIKLKMADGETKYDIKVDIVPAIRVMDRQGCNMDKLYTQMSRQLPNVREHYSACLVQKQRSFTRAQDSTVKRLMKLTKYWKHENDLALNSYTCELLSIDACKEGCRDVTRGFKNVLEKLKTYNNLNVEFSEYYNPDKWRSYFPKDEPYVMDPANPFMNTCKHDLKAGQIRHIEECATDTLNAIK